MSIYCLRHAHDHSLEVVTICAVLHFDSKLQARCILVKQAVLAHDNVLFFGATAGPGMETAAKGCVVKLLLVERDVVVECQVATLQDRVLELQLDVTVKFSFDLILVDESELLGLLERRLGHLVEFLVRVAVGRAIGTRLVIIFVRVA